MKKEIHPYRLRPYHNPEGIDESKVPAGWRFRYADEANQRAQGPCKWIGRIYGSHYSGVWFDSSTAGTNKYFTYIVPVDA